MFKEIPISDAPKYLKHFEVYETYKEYLKMDGKFFIDDENFSYTTGYYFLKDIGDYYIIYGPSSNWKEKDEWIDDIKEIGELGLDKDIWIVLFYDLSFTTINRTFLYPDMSEKNECYDFEYKIDENKIKKIDDKEKKIISNGFELISKRRCIYEDSDHYYLPFDDDYEDYFEINDTFTSYSRYIYIRKERIFL